MDKDVTGGCQTGRAFADGRVTLHAGDCREVLAALPEASVDSVMCDPPYHLVSGNARGGGFMGEKWDGGDIAFRAETWAAVFRVLKPGAHLLAFGATRTYHRMVCGIEDAGFEIRDQLAWVYGSGFPKSHDVSKAIDRAAGKEPEVVSEWHTGFAGTLGGKAALGGLNGAKDVRRRTAPATEAAKQWEGWGTALKPAWEPIVLARKPLVGTVAQNILKWGTGALNIDGCRVAPTGERLGGGGEKRETAGKFTNEGWRRPWMDDPEHSEAFANKVRANVDRASALGRWPANICHDGSPEVLAAFPESSGQQARVSGNEPTANGFSGAVAFSGMRARMASAEPRGDSGSAARFFYTAKADSEDRLGSKHPTVKPLDLMQWLVRLVTPRGGLVLDPFAGTGTTGEAAWREGMRAVLIERKPE